MKHAGILFLTLILGVPAAFAERDGRAHHYERHLERVIEELQLSAEQEPQVRTILEEQHGKLRNEMENMREQIKPRLEAIGDETKERLSTVLNEEQLQTFSDSMEKKREHMKKRFKGMRSHDSDID